MKLSNESKIIIIFFIIYFFFSWILTSTYYINHQKYIANDWWTEWHGHIGTGQRGSSGDSNQFRLISYWTAEGTSKLFNIPIFTAYLLDRFLVTFIIFCLFHIFLLKWFKHKGAFLGVTLLAAITPITYLPFLQEADYWLQLFFLIGLWIIRDSNWKWLTLLLFIATFAKETIVFLIPFYFLVNWKHDKKTSVILKSFGLVIIWVAAYYITRNLFYEGINSSIWQLSHNVEIIKTYFKYPFFINIGLDYIPLFGMFWVLTFWNLKKKPQFFRTVPIYVVIFMVLHFIMAWPEETRIILPLAFLIIPSSIMSIDFLIDGDNKKPHTE